MEYRSREHAIDRILAGFTFFRLNGSLLKVLSPNRLNFHRAELYKEDIWEENKYGDWLTETQMENLLFKLNQLPLDYKDTIKENQEKIENLKVEIYEEKLSAKKREFTRRTIRSLEKQISKYNGRLNQFAPLTLQGFSDLCRSDYIVYETVLDNDNSPILDEVSSFTDFSEIVTLINDMDISIVDYRKLARSEPWRSYWYCNKQNPFGAPISEWTEQQRHLVVFSRMYDNVYESSECPSDDIIEDDDRLDGWFVVQNRKAKKERQESETVWKRPSGTTGGDKFAIRRNKADEHYIVGNTAEEREYISKMNNDTARHIKKQRLAMVKQKGRVKECELPDRQRQLQMQRVQKYKEAVKGQKS